MQKQTDLITVPTFTFNQGDIWNSEMEIERPISVDFYNGTIVLRQDGEFEIQESIKIHPKYFEALVKAIRKHLPQAEAMLKIKYGQT